MTKLKDATGPPNFYLTQADYYQLTGPGYWEVSDVPRERWGQCGDHFNNPDTVAVFASGCHDPVTSKGEQATGGIDWIRLEPNPQPNEPNINVNHYVIGMPDDQQRYPVWGPFNDGNRIDHWPEGNDLGPYSDGSILKK